MSMWKIGDTFILSHAGRDRFECSPEAIFTISRKNGPDTYGMTSDKRVRGWHDLDGFVPDGFGWWLEEDELNAYMMPYNEVKEVVVSRDFNYKSQNLRGMQGTLLRRMLNGDWALVEFEKDIGGGGGDGLGQNGHCVPVPTEVISEIKIQRRKKNG